MPGPKGILGAKGEKAARSYLKKHGYRIIANNYRTKYGEIDLIARQGDFIAFIEVRTKASISFGTPEESITRLKREHLIAAAEAYLQTTDTSLPWRIDLVAIEATPEGKVKEVRLIQNAIELG